MYSNYLVLKKLSQPFGFALNKLLQPVCLLFRVNFVKYLIYMASLIMVGLSFGPFIVIRYHSWDGFRGEMISIMYDMPSLFISLFSLPILAIFLSSILIIWTHKGGDKTTVK